MAVPLPLRRVPVSFLNRRLRMVPRCGATVPRCHSAGRGKMRGKGPTLSVSGCGLRRRRHSDTAVTGLVSSHKSSNVVCNTTSPSSLPSSSPYHFTPHLTTTAQSHTASPRPAHFDPRQTRRTRCGCTRRAHAHAHRINAYLRLAHNDTVRVLVPSHDFGSDVSSASDGRVPPCSLACSLRPRR